MISEGLDVPRIECANLLRPTLSLGLHLQQVGRGLRPAADKPHLVILDAVGNCLKHGLPADPREWSLDSKPRRLRKRDKPAGPRCCPNCGCVTRAPVCEACGEVMGAPREIERRPGELVELTPRELRRIKYAPLRHVLNGTETFPELQRIAKLRGYHPKWARHALEEQAERRAGAGR